MNAIMLRAYWITWVVSALTFGQLSAQQSNLELLFTLPKGGEEVAFDRVGWFYILDGDELIKFSQGGKEEIRESFKLFGTPQFLDATNPLKLVLFYRDFNQVVITDNKLMVRGEPLSLANLGYVQASAVCTSYDAGLWIYDQFSFELVRLNRNLEVTNRTANLQQTVGSDLDLIELREAGNWVYGRDEVGVRVFDVYGTYYKTIPIPNVDAFWIHKETLYCMRDQQLVVYQLKDQTQTEIHLPQGDFTDFSVFENKLLLSTKKQAFLYQFNQ